MCGQLVRSSAIGGETPGSSPSFIDLEKAYDTVPSSKIWESL